MSKRRTARQSDARPKKSHSAAMPAHDKAAQAREDTFQGSDPVAMESPLVTGGPRKRD
jgi:hypothetical protein